MAGRGADFDGMRAGLQAVCDALGLKRESLGFSAAERMFVIAGTGVSVRTAARNGSGQDCWQISERYQVADPSSGWTDRQESKGIFEFGDETACARSAGLAIAAQRIDAALDAAG